MLRGLPGVVEVEVEVGVKVEKPTQRIIHLRDWHFVPKDLFALDVGKGATAQEIDRLYREHLLEVEVVQMEQMALLRCLIRHHGLKTVFCEGLTPGELPNFRETVAVLRDMERKDIPRIKAQLVEVQEMLQGMKPTTDRYEKAKAVERELTEMLYQHKVRLLQLGAPGRLLVAGEVEEVLPPDDAGLLPCLLFMVAHQLSELR